MRHFQSCDSLSDPSSQQYVAYQTEKLETAVQPARLVRPGAPPRKRKKAARGKIPNNRRMDVCRHGISIYSLGECETPRLELYLLVDI